ncbi:hypothetical protein [Prosthecobacter vanneervenii]|uniref:Uncharacterized protein n=1 Tax=Prosthecobacter vanneervenii TaxID=48466 RepID=A0A7W8DLC1_9BACT|nr:hypothetical protein [Prosthecobacter vanneervenii]MBB5033681.1 hypothetical protein [Prosthecobacter vanneervenii]
MTELIEVKLTELNQLFNSLDPSPFHERDLDHDAEEFIVSWAQEHPHKHDLKLLVHLAKAPAGVADAQKLVSDSIAHYFEYRAEMTLREFKRLMREGRKSLLIGLLFLALCQFAARLLAPSTANWQSFAGEGLTIMGWVAMWKPLEIYLYRWWPLLALRKLYQRLSRMPVEVRCSSST